MALLQRLLTLLVLGRGWAAPSCLLGPTCPPGSVCPTGSSRPLPCPVGRFVPTPGSVGYGDCLACTPGFYCNASGLSAPSGPCAPGYYCPSGSTSATAVTCPSGNYCPGAAPAPVPCSPGTYQNTTGSSSCSPCLQGFRCPTSGLASYLPCLPGHFCPGSTISTENPCPAGRYSPSTQLTSASQCLPCPPGKYCAGTANTAPTAPCAPGFACFGGASAATPADNVTGQACAPGAFCPSGSTRALPCPAGSYCATSQLTNTSGFCDAGYICYGSATRSAPTDGVTGIRVPAGFWSASGDVSPTPCPVGRFAPSPGNPSPSSCLLCTPGFYCASTGLSGPTAPCTSGYYCPSGTIAPTLLCPPGSQCPQQAATAMPCPAGTYQDLYGQALCKTCPQGYFCAGSGNTGFALCPPGAYCPSNTTFANQFPCPSGTFSNLTGLVTAAECTPCPPSQYCLGVGQTQPTASCWPGYYCSGGSTSPTPLSGLCPAGKYCPYASSQPASCAPGTFTVGTGNTNASACVPCPGGRYCPVSGAVAMTGNNPCDAGYLCTGGSFTPQPSPATGGGHICPVGTYCPQGAIAELQCDPGTYNPSVGQAACQTCPAGTYCPSVGMTSFLACPMGYYCPARSPVPIGCPAGRFSQRVNLTQASDCPLCPAGQYCAAVNLTSPTGNCSAGSWCHQGSAAFNAAPCPAGSWCPSGTPSPVLCDVGTYNPSNGSATRSACLPCLAGTYCDKVGMSTPSGNCSASYYCPAGSSTPQAVICPAGRYCPPASPAPVPCPVSFYQDNVGQRSCKPCPAGSYCPSADTTTPIPCPAGGYCPAGGDATCQAAGDCAAGHPLPCSNGTYSTIGSLSSQSQCNPCVAGKYCQAGVIAGDCAAGWLCTIGAGSPTPPGGLCPLHHYCSAGTPTAVPCANNTANFQGGGQSQADCQPCPAGMSCSGTPSSCPAGYYCPHGIRQIPCPPGTYNDVTGTSTLLSCKPCPASRLCWTDGVSQPNSTVYDCPAGYFCPQGSSSGHPCLAGTYRPLTGGVSQQTCSQCPGGYYCSTGCSQPTPCPVGNYCPSGAAAPFATMPGWYSPPLAISPTPCSPGFYCPANSSYESQCGPGTFCPSNSSAPALCPLGMASNPSTAGPRSSVGQACVTCPIGTFGADPQRLQCRTCTPGYICLQGCTSATPQTVAEDNGYPCPAGSYCVNSTATPCPAGSFSPAPAGADRSACQPCAQGTYSALPGQVGCRQCGSSALSTSTSDDNGSIGTRDTFPTGATGCQCAGKHRAYQAADATCQCVPGYTSLDGAIDGISDCYPIVYPSSCPSGTVLSNSGQCTSTDCNSTCNGPGTFDPTYSICNCDHANRVACDEACRATAPSTQICNGTSICITNPATGATTVTPLSSLPGYSGNVQCPSGTNCNTVMFVAGGDGQKAVYGIPPVLQTTSTLPAARSTTKAPMRMLLSFDSDRNRWEALEASSTTSPAASALPGYTSPTVCLSQYDSLVFDLSAGPTHYPVYDKDNLLNTNPNFDWSSFRLLASQANADPGSIQVFAFTFTTAGTYVFYDNADRSKVTTAVVAPDGVSCPSGGAIMGTTPQNLVQLGVIRSTNLLTTPNLMTIVYLVGAFISALVIVYVYSKFRAKTMSLKGYDFVGGDTSHVASDIVALKQALAEHRDDERKMFEKQKCDIEAMVVKIGAESEQLKALLAVKLSGPTTSSLFLDVAERLMAGELAARRSYERRQVRVEADIDDRLKQLDTAASAIVDAGPDAAQDVNRVQRAARDVCERISTWNSLVTTERHRRQTIVEHIGTIGERAAQVFTAHDGDEDRAEDALRDALAACSSAVQRVSASLTGICDQFAARHLELMQARNASALAQLTSRHRVQQVSVCRELRTGLQRTFAQLRTASAALSSARQTCRRSNESGCEVVRQERRKLEAEQRARATTADGDGRAARTVQTGLFAGLHSGLAAALEQMIGGPHALLDLEQALEARRADEDADSSSATSREHAGRQWDGRAQMDAALDDEWRRRLLKIEDVRLQAISSSDAVQRGNEAARRLRRDVMRHRLRAALFAAVLLRDRNVDRRLAQQRDSNAQQERANAYAKIEEWYEAQREADLAAILKLEHAGKGPEEMAQLQQAMRSADLCATEDAGGPVEVDPVSEEEVEMRREHNRVLREIRLRQQVEAESGPSVDARDHERELNREMRAMDRELMDLRSKQMRKLERQQLDEMEVDKVSKQVITDVLSRRHLHEAIGAVRLLFADLCDIALCDDADPDRVVAALSYNATRIIAVHNAHVDEVTQERGRFCIPTNDLNEERATFAADVNALLKRLVDSIATEHRERQEDAVRTARLESAMKVIEEGLAQEREHFDRESNSEQAWQRLLDKQQGIRERNLATIRAQVNAELRAQREAGALKLMPVPEDPIGTGAEEALQLGSVLDTGAIKSKLESIEGALCRFVEGRGSFEHPLNSSSTLAIGHIVVADLATVSAPVFLCHRLGQALVSLLSVSTPHVSLQLVTRLPRPSPALASNPFSNLFLYDPVDRVLSVRDEVAGDVGDFAMVVVHTLAHIRSEDWTETGPVFLRELLVLVRLLSLQALTNGSPLPALSTRDAMSAYVDLRRARDLADQYAQDARFLDRLEQYRSVVNNAAIQEHIAATMKSLPASVLPVQLPDAARRNETTLDSSHLLGQVDDAHGDLLSILTEAHQLSRTVTDLDMNADGSMATQETLSAARDRLHRLHLHKVDIANKLAILERLCASLTQ